MPNTSEPQQALLPSGSVATSLDAAPDSADGIGLFLVLDYCVDCDYGSEPDGSRLCSLCGGRCL